MVRSSVPANETTLLVTKFALPPVPAGFVPRPRLAGRLEQIQSHALILIAAPAGFGKTTMLASWLRQATFPTAWVSLESSDDDPSRLWPYLFAALERVIPGSSSSAVELLRQYGSQPPLSLEDILTVWINALADLPHPVVLVLDDYHLIMTQAIHHGMAYLINHLPANLHLILSTRADPPLPLARMRTRGLLVEIRAADLRFTREETAAFLTQALGLTLSAEDLAALEARTEGWIAGLQLAALSMQGRNDITDFIQGFTGSHRYIIDYLVEEVLAQQPDPIQKFLLCTSVLERLEGTLCETVAGEASSEGSGQGMLEQVERANLFLTPFDDVRLWYRYHPLFAEALRHQLQRRYPSLAPELHRRASRWYEQHGLIRDAVHHALAAADYALAVRLMEQAGNALVSQGEIYTLQQWVSALPPDLVRSRLEIAVWQSWLLFVHGKQEEALRHLEAIERTFNLQPAGQDRVQDKSVRETEIYGRIAAIRASIAIAQGDLPHTITFSRLALAHLPKESMARSYVAGYLGKAHYYQGDLTAASQALEEACRISLEVRHFYGFFLVVYDLANLQIQQGKLAQADQTCRQALQQANELGEQSPARGPALVVLGKLEREWNHLDAAAALFQDGIRLCEQTINLSAIVQAYIGLAFIHQAQGNPEMASVMLQQATRRAEQPHVARSRSILEAQAAQARLALMQGDRSTATRWMQQVGLDGNQPPEPLHERAELPAARILIAQHKHEEAQQRLERLLRAAESQGRTGNAIEILLLQAEACQASGAMDRAIQQLSQALSLAETQGYTRLFVDEGEPLARLLEKMQMVTLDDRQGLQEYRKKLLALMRNEQSQVASRAGLPISVPAVQPLIEPLNAREREILRLIAAGSSNKEIADELVIAVSTVKWYVNAIYAKLQVESRTKAIVRARERNLL